MPNNQNPSDKKNPTKHFYTSKRPFKGFWMPAEIGCHPRLNSTEKLIFAEILALDREIGCVVSNEYLATMFNITIVTVSRSIAKFKEEGLVAQEGFNGRVRILKTNIKAASKPFAEKVLRDLEGMDKNRKGYHDDIDSLISDDNAELSSLINIGSSLGTNLGTNSSKELIDGHDDRSPLPEKEENPPEQKRKRRRKLTRTERSLSQIIQKVWCECPTVTTHKKNTKTWKTILQYLLQLHKGTFIEGKHFDDGWVSKLPEEFIKKKWDLKEIKDVLSDLTKYSMPGYWPEDKKNWRHLSVLLYNDRTGKSMFLTCAAKPPIPFSEERHIATPKDEVVNNILNAIIDELHLTEKQVKKYKVDLLYAAKQLKIFHAKLYLDIKAVKRQFFTPMKLCLKYMAYINEQNTYEIDLNKLGPNYQTFKNFINWIEEDIGMEVH